MNVRSRLMFKWAKYERNELSREYETGWTWKSMLAILFAGVAVLPLNLYLFLVSGASMAVASTFIVAILFSQLASFLGTRIRKQELFIIYAVSGIVAGNPAAIFLVYRHYYINSYVTRTFMDPYSGRPVPDAIPDWWVPPLDSPANELRSFLHADWLLPYALSFLQFGILVVVSEIALAIMSAHLYIRKEKLPFPLANIGSQMVTTLAERPRDRMYVFTLALSISAAYSFFLYGLPALSLGAYNVQLQFIPTPWLDLTAGFYGIEQFMPGAALGIHTDPIIWATGFLLGLDVLACILIGSLSCWVFGNWVALNYLQDVFPLWAQEWTKGMSLALVWQRSTLRIWSFLQVGFMLALALVTIAPAYKVLARGLGSIGKQKKGFVDSEYPAFWKALAVYIVSVGLSIVVLLICLPDFPIWIAMLAAYGFGTIMTLAGTRSIGETGVVITMPYMWQGTVLLSGYRKIGAWFVYPTIGGTYAPSWVQNLRIAELTETKPMDFFKAYFFGFLVYNFLSLIFVEFYWSIAPIPSSIFPYTLMQWPYQATIDNMWISRQITAKPEVLGMAFLGMSALGIAGQAISRFAGLPFSFAGLVAGTVTIPPIAIAYFLGGLLGQLLIKRFVGEEWWNSYRAILVAGIAAGEGLIVGIFSTFILLFKSVWILPF